MLNEVQRNVVARLTGALITLGTLTACQGCGERHTRSDSAAPTTTAPARIIVADQHARLVQFPCESCHVNVDPQALATSSVKRHPDVQVAHFPGAEQCTQCHDPAHVDHLRLLDGTTVPLYRAAEACGQCHFRQREDWTRGAHGKTVGNWQRERYRYNCTDCHNAHHPKRSPVEAMPPPPRPELSIRKTEHDE